MYSGDRRNLTPWFVLILVFGFLCKNLSGQRGFRPYGCDDKS